MEADCGTSSYSLCFVVASPDPKAQALALKVAIDRFGDRRGAK